MFADYKDKHSSLALKDLGNVWKKYLSWESMVFKSGFFCLLRCDWFVNCFILLFQRHASLKPHMKLQCYFHENILLTWKLFFTNMSVKHNCLNYHKNKARCRNKFIEIQIHWDLKLIQKMLKKWLLLVYKQVMQSKS